MLALAIMAFSFSGCASSVTRAPGSSPGGYKVSATNQVTGVTVNLSGEAQEKLKDNLKFDQEELRKHVERALVGASLLNASKKGEVPTVEILVTSIRVRSNFSAVMWGAMAGRDNIQGDIILRDAAGAVLDRFKVSASYALGGLAGGQDNARMGWMYEEFAKQAVQEMTGVKK